MSEIPGNRKLLQKYAGMAFQFLLMIGFAVWMGWQLDKTSESRFPIFIWLLPLIAIISLMIKAIMDTNSAKKNKD